MSKSFNLTYFGNIKALVASGAQIGFVTQHEEGLPTALFLIDTESNKLSSIDLPCGGLSLARLGETFWIGGTDGSLYSATAKDKAATKSKVNLPSNAKTLVAISDTEFACLCEEQVLIVASGKIAQTLELKVDGETDSPTALHANPDGKWLAIGGLSGNVSVFQREEQDEFALSESASLHQGEVTSILFEPEELRFFSAGADQKLLLTHARGTLEPEDRGRANNHDQRVTSMLLAGDGRFITGSLDKTCKSWARVGATKPSTLSDGLVAVTNLAMATVHKRSMLVAAQSDNSIRLFLVDEAGKFGQANDRYNDVYFRANALLDSNSASDRGVALHDLAALDDLKSIRLIANRIGADNDPKLRMTAVELLCKSKHAKHREQLQLCLGDRNEPVRRAVFDYLAKSEEDSNELLKLCKQAVLGGNPDIGCEAVKVLQKLSTSKSESDSFRNRARDVIVSAFESNAIEIRRSAVLALESVYEKNSPRPNLIAMQSNQADSRRIGLIRLMQRKLLADSDAAAGIRKKIEDSDADVRKAAALMLILSRKKLADAIRERDDDINRQLSDLESFTIEVETKKTKGESSGSKKAVKKAKKKTKLAKPKIADEDYQPLLIAVASRSVDTCLMGARCLALLEDPRAFGLLMQLSRETEESARVDACNALAALGDPRAKDRLAAMLADESIAVRDAAYSALNEIGEDDPVTVAADGLAAKQEDVRRRGLDTLIKHVRKAKPKSTDEDSVQLLLQTLNDPGPAVRGEAFKFVLNSKIGGAGDKCLRLGLTSSHADIRREVLNETLGQKKESWAPALMQDLLDDPDESLRAEVFSELKKDKKDSDIEWLGDAIGRKYEDIRELACKRLAANRTVASRELLLKAIDDDKPAIRQLVLRSLVHDGALEQLVEALGSSKIDVKLGAAKALARIGDMRAKDVLVELAQQESPTVESLQIDGLRVADLESFVEVWRFGVTGALDGLAMLGDPATIECALSRIDDEDAAVREHAASALVWLADEKVTEQLRPLLKHADSNVAVNAAMALAMAGDSIGLPILFSEDNHADQVQRLISATVLGEKAEGRLINFLDTAHPANRNAGMIVLLCRDHLLHESEPRRAIVCLAAQDPRVRLCSASFVENFGDEKAFAELLDFVFNNRGDEKPWTIAAEDLKKVAVIIAHGDSRLVAKLIQVLRKLDSDKQKEWDFEWNQFAARYANEIDGLLKKAKPPKSKSDAGSLKQLAFGTWVGLARDQSRARQSSFGFGSVAVRVKALSWLVAAAKEDKSLIESTVSVLTQTAGDPSQEIRSFAFAQLEELGVPDEDRAAIAIETGHLDLAVTGLTLLTSTGSKSKRQTLLKSVILNRNDRIAVEAATLLKNEMDEVKVCEICFDSPNVNLPPIAVNWLAALFESNAAAQKILRSVALDSEDERMRRRAIQTLVSAKDKTAFDALVKVNEANPDDNGYLKMFALLGDERSGGYLLDRIDADHQFDAKAYLQEVGNTLDASLADRLINGMEAWPKRRDMVYKSLLQISGYNQSIYDRDDEYPDQSWLEKQHPRHDDVLAKLLEATNRFGTVGQLRPLIAAARWAKSEVVQQPLELLAIHADESVRHEALEALGFRARKREGGTDVLESACDHRNPITKFLAAEGLALAGNDSGMQILLTAIELVEDLRLRKRAVLALGHLADERAFEVLFNLASDTGHALQDSALEAVGHLRDSPNRDQILQTLLQSVNAGGSIGRNALVGLRWLDVPEGWDRIRELASQESELRATAVAQLGYDDDPATKDCVLCLAESYPVSEQALYVAKQVFGEKSVEADLVWASNNPQANYDANLSTRVLHRVREYASADQLFELLGGCPESWRQPLIQHLLKQDPLPVATAAKLLESESPRVVEAGAWIIGRAADSKHSKALVAALDRQVQLAVNLNQEMVLANRYSDTQLDQLNAGIGRTIWALGVLGGSEQKFAELITDHAGRSNLTPIRHAAAEAIVQSEKLTAATVKLLKPVVDDHDPLIRSLVAEALSKVPKTDLETLAGDLISDRVAFSKLASQNPKALPKTLKSAAADAHYQSRALALLVDSGDAKTLGDVASDGDLDLFTRMGAVEGLAKMMDAKCEKTLESIGKDEKCDEELRKAAWRGLRRSKRRRLAKQKA